MIADLPRFDIWTGWLALLILLPLAVTSADFLVRRMGVGGSRCSVGPMPPWSSPCCMLSA
ncbi:MAG: hypothetical protein JKP98_14250 [Rhodobacteraceae bacterium]|nr:hypothetical protein [Paracoccaceae bacterium]